MIELAAEARTQFFVLLDHYNDIGRIEASLSLIAAVERASAAIERDPKAGLPARRPYPQIARSGRLWTKPGRYWFAYSVAPLTILAIFYDTADIPGRVSHKRD